MQCLPYPMIHRLVALLAIGGTNPLRLMVALLVLATYKELLPRVGLRRLVFLGLLCSGLEVLYSILVCMYPTPEPSLFTKSGCPEKYSDDGHSLAPSGLGDACSSSLVRLRHHRWRGYSAEHDYHQVYCRYLTAQTAVSVLNIYVSSPLRRVIWRVIALMLTLAWSAWSGRIGTIT